MKKCIGILSVLCIVASMSGCEGDGSKTSKKSSSAEVTTDANESEKMSEEEKTSEEKIAATEETTKKATKSEEEIKAQIIANDTEYLEKIQPYLLDVSVCDIKDAHFETSYDVYESDYSGIDKATILTVGYDYNTTTTKWIDRIEIVDNNDNAVVQTSYNTSWSTTDEDEQLWGVVRYRVAGEYSPEDLKIKLVYDDDYDVSVQKDFSAALGFEEFGQNFYWNEDVNPYWEDASEAEEFNPIKHSCFYKINGRYCFVDETYGTSSGGSSGEKNISYTGRGFHITPLQGGLGPVLTKDEVSVESGNTQPYMYCELDEFHEDDIANRIEINICCVTSDTDWYDNWDSISEEQKMGKEDAEDLVTKYKRYEARASYLCVPDGEGGITKIECTQM